MSRVQFCLHISSPLPQGLGHIPMAPAIDFAALAADAGATGVLDPNSIEIYDKRTGDKVEYGLGEDLLYGQEGHLEWVICDPSSRTYIVHFQTVEQRPPLVVPEAVPLVGIGDLLRYNAGNPGPVVLSGSVRLVDLTGNGLMDMVGCWNYYHRPGWPIGGVVCYPRTEEPFCFGEMVRLRYVETYGQDHLCHFSGTYPCADFTDVNGDGLVDIIFAEEGSGTVRFFLNTGDRDSGGWPIFVRDQSLKLPFPRINDLQLLDLNGDGVLDMVINGHFVQNINPEGWPFIAASPVDIGSCEAPAFLDLDGDGVLEMVCLDKGADKPFAERLTWHRQVRPLVFDKAGDLGIVSKNDLCTQVRTIVDGTHQGLLLHRNAFQELVTFELVSDFCFNPPLRAESLAAVASWSDQAWPCMCDWNGDGIQDLLIGGGYGWPRIVLNKGSNTRPRWAEPEYVCAKGKPIRLLRDDILPAKHWHNMGYPYPVFVDWDGDDLPDLILPNETNRIVWYRNIGTRKRPEFGQRLFMTVDGFDDSVASRTASARDGENQELQNHPYPYDQRSAFFWRTGAAFADWNDDGLMDFITHSYDRRATLFVQYIDANGKRRLRHDGPVLLEDGRVIDDAIVGRQKHWTESFRCVDWNGDGLMDLIYNLAGTGEIYLLRNVGNKKAPVFAAPRQFSCYGDPIAFTVHGPNAWAGDFNGDGKPDLLGCVEWSVYPFYAHAALEMNEHPRFDIHEVRLC